jgi:hypothetical protein
MTKLVRVIVVMLRGSTSPAILTGEPKRTHKIERAVSDRGAPAPELL